jgi:hypothetical protein
MSGEDVYRVYFTKEEIEDLIMNLEQCESEGYLTWNDAAYFALQKLIRTKEFYD